MSLRLDELEAGLPATNATRWREHIASGRTMIGLWSVAASVANAEILARSGADWVLIDTEHSATSISDVQGQVRVLDAAPVFTVVRASSKNPLELGKLLDIGVRGIMVPMIESADDAREAVASTRYPPAGRRGVGGGFARATRWTAVGDYLARAQESFSLIAQIETVGGLDNLDGILATEGIDAFFVGPADLAASLGYLGEPRHPVVRSAVEDVIRRGVESGRVMGVNAFGTEDAIHYRELGAQLLAGGSDVTLLSAASAYLVAQLQAPVADRPTTSEGTEI